MKEILFILFIGYATSTMAQGLSVGGVNASNNNDSNMEKYWWNCSLPGTARQQQPYPASSYAQSKRTVLHLACKRCKNYHQQNDDGEIKQPAPFIFQAAPKRRLF
ncbi:MAG: hypothetical protein JST67_07435 [Bacteroidetes bacterium]|nr:hypothetical protein [Bacteroidota bacterium]